MHSPRRTPAAVTSEVNTQKWRQAEPRVPPWMERCFKWTYASQPVWLMSAEKEGEEKKKYRGRGGNWWSFDRYGCTWKCQVACKMAGDRYYMLYLLWLLKETHSWRPTFKRTFKISNINLRLRQHQSQSIKHHLTTYCLSARPVQQAPPVFVSLSDS